MRSFLRLMLNTFSNFLSKGLLILALVISLSGVAQAKTCKENLKRVCETSDTCTWVKGYTTKKGTVIKPYCRNKGKKAGNKAATTKKATRKKATTGKASAKTSDKDSRPSKVEKKINKPAKRSSSADKTKEKAGNKRKIKAGKAKSPKKRSADKARKTADKKKLIKKVKSKKKKEKAKQK